VALVGEKHDAHDFLGQVAAAGCDYVVATRVPQGWTGTWVEVPDTLVALQDLGRAVRRAFVGPVVGITGSAGKTTTRVLVMEVLAALGRVHGTRGNLNNHVGVPLTLLALEESPPAAALVLEMGMNHRGEIAVLQDIGAPTIRLVTNVGAAHVEGCGSIEGVALAKQEIFDGARAGDVCVVNLDDPRVAAMPLPAGVRRVTYGRHPDADARLVEVRVDAEALVTHLRVITREGVVESTLAVPGEHLAHNACAAVAVGLAAGVPLATMGASLARYAPEGMRNRVERIGGLRVIDDAYNANPTSMEAALRLLASLPPPRVAVLGDMFELGSVEAESHVAVLALARALPLDAVHVTGARMCRAAAAVPGVHAHEDAEALAGALADSIAPSTAVLVKGSRGARMERVTALLREAHAASAPTSARPAPGGT
jgi:UDP-N-acetylmuramoyl-tripeptide--D-alanyl-D-alanine ligase